MRIKYVGIFFLICGLFSACQQKNISSRSNETTTKVPSIIVTEKLQVFNLSEDMSPISTHSDEVVLNIFLLEQKENTLTEIDHFYSPSLSFDQKGQSHSIMDSLTVGTEKRNDLIAVFTLTELDEEDSVAKVQKTLKRELLTGKFLNHIDAMHMDTILGFDDFLGMHYLFVNKMKKEKAFELKFKGRQLFDKFEYRLTGTSF